MSQYLARKTRRNFLAAAAGLGFAGGLFTDIRVASAQAMTGAPPEVDRLSIRVVIAPGICARIRFTAVSDRLWLYARDAEQQPGHVEHRSVEV